MSFPNPMYAERIRELPSELGFRNLARLCHRYRIDESRVSKIKLSSSIRLDTLCRLANDLEVFPVVLYDANNHLVAPLHREPRCRITSSYIFATIQWEREQRDWSLQYLAGLVDIKDSNLRQYEDNSRLPTIDLFEDICSVLELSPKYFVLPEYL